MRRMLGALLVIAGLAAGGFTGMRGTITVEAPAPAETPATTEAVITDEVPISDESAITAEAP